MLQDIRARKHKGLLVEDITGGLEDVPIPVFNEVRVSLLWRMQYM
jgi:hypothetical protein